MENKHSHPLYINNHEVTFFVNDNVVVAKILEWCCNDAIEAVGDRFCNPYYDIPRKFFRTFQMTEHPYATAKCDPRDTFDEEYGRRLAFERLKVTYWSQFENRIGKINDYLLKLFDDNSELMTKISEKYLQKEWTPDGR